MLELQATKKVFLESASFTNGATASVQIDTIGYDAATIDLSLGRVNAATNTVSTCKLQESDTTNSTSFADISGSSFTNALTTLSTSAGTYATWDLTLLPRKRYLQVVVTPITTEIIGATINLSRAEQSPVTATAKNVSAWLIL